MTRINCVSPTELCNKHLLAEYRELPRIFSIAKPIANIPKKYTLGKGHVIFFYDKLLFLKKRQENIINELKNRGFKINFMSDNLGEQCNPKLFNDWLPDAEAIYTNRLRINDRLFKMSLKELKLIKS